MQDKSFTVKSNSKYNGQKCLWLLERIIQLPQFPIHLQGVGANNKIRRQANEKFIDHRHYAWNSHCHCAVLQYVKQFTKKSKTCLCKQNRRHHYVNNRSCSFILYKSTNRVRKYVAHTRFVLLYTQN